VPYVGTGWRYYKKFFKTGRRNRWIKHLKQNFVEEPRQIQRFGETRWTSWFLSGFDIYEWFEYIPSFIQDEVVIAQQKSNLKIMKFIHKLNIFKHGFLNGKENLEINRSNMVGCFS